MVNLNDVQADKTEPCPWAGCLGTARMISREETTKGTLLGIDRNQRLDVFQCTACARTSTRRWEWRRP